MSSVSRSNFASVSDDFSKLIASATNRAKRRKLFNLFPDDGPFRRDLYPKHVEFFDAGARWRERCFMAANRIGKTEGAGYECATHLTGWYPSWWRGQRWKRPITCWACGTTNETTRDIVQTKLLGNVVDGNPKTFDGTGMIPFEWIGRPTWRQGVQNLADTVPIRSLSGGWSIVGFKSFEQRRKSFEGTQKDVIWLDEECPLDIYTECLIRTASTTGRPEDNGRLLLTFTPLEGLTDTVLQYLPADHVPAAA